MNNIKSNELIVGANGGECACCTQPWQPNFYLECPLLVRTTFQNGGCLKHPHTCAHTLKKKGGGGGEELIQLKLALAAY